MRKKIKRNIKNIIQTMLEAHNHVLELMKDRCIPDVNDILEQCQECAIHIGETIEKSEGTDVKAVFYLENYCEQLYRMSRTGEKKIIKNLKTQLDKSLHCVEYELDENISLDKQKIVFMPYKVSMWDCMESVWEAAVSDEKCEVYVVPIPYYEKDSEGNVIEFCYEGGEFPKYIPITPYNEFLLHIEQPDIVYIHNPYDGANYVTSVHPNYYSSNLKKYTDLLIYIPYFICGNGSMPETHLNLPAYQYIDYIIVQDKEKKKSLIDFMPEEKIIVIGSPKIDKILMLKNRNELVNKKIPQKWRKIISGKKVILFNVSISGILQKSKVALEKIRYVISTFKEKDNVVLLWRPHPLLEATLKSMRPDLYEEYMEIKNAFIKEGKGIFDETEDACIVAAMADAYLGESSSSLVHYFGALGKPVLYTEWEVLEEKQKNREFLDVQTFFREGDSLFFVPANAGMEHELYRLNLKQGKLEREISLPGTSNNLSQCYMGIKKIQNKIILAPNNVEDIYIYDLEKKRAIKIVLSESCNKLMLFDGAIEFEDKIFLLPQCYPAIVSIDSHLNVHEFKECIRPFLLNDKYDTIFSWAYLKKGIYLYLASAIESRIIKFNMENGNYEIKNLGEYQYGYGHMIYDGEYFWFAGYKENSIVRWNEESGDTEEYNFPISRERSKDKVWSLLINKGEEIAICDGFSLNMIFMNKKTGKCRNDKQIKKVLKKLEDRSEKNRAGFVAVDVLDEDRVLLIEWKSSTVNIWNMKKNQWEHIYCRRTKEEIFETERKQIEEYYISKSVPYSLSESVLSISQYVDYITSGNTKVFENVYECYHTNEDSISIGFNVHEIMSNIN